MIKRLNKNFKIGLIAGLFLLSITISPANSMISIQDKIFMINDHENNLFLSDVNWWNEDWEYRKVITINCSLVDEDLADFPILVHHTSNHFASHAQSDGDDFVFIGGDNSTQYNHEIELYNGTSGELIAWVNIDSISSSTDTIFYIYYGNPLASNQENIAETWNEGYVGVYHLNEGGTGTRYDSTDNDNDGSPSGYDGDEAILAGMIGGADDFDGQNDNIKINDNPSLDITGDITFSAWIKFKATAPARYEIINKLYWYDEYLNSGYFLKIDWDDKFSTGILNNYSESLKTYSVSKDIWYYAVGTWNGTHLVFYVDGNMEGTPVETSISSIGTNDENLRIGASTKDSYYWNGSIDEVRISNVARSAEWIETSYEMVIDNGAFLFVGVEEEFDGDPPEIVDNSPEVAYTGNEFTFNFTITDISGISEATLIYHYNDDSAKNAILNNTNGDYWEYTIIVEDVLGYIEYMVCVWDNSGNNNHTDDKEVTIVDDDLPVISDVEADPEVQESGEKVYISAEVTDNINVSDVGIYLIYPDSSTENFSIKENQIDDTYYSNRAYDQGGIHTFYIWAIDTSDNYNYTVDFEFEIVLGEKPSDPQITGETHGKIGESYSYEFSSTDSDGDDIYYYIDWGDGNVEEWVGPYASGEIITMSHSWEERNFYTIKAKAKDTKDLESDWGQLKVNMPKSYNFFCNLMNWLAELFPVFKILFSGFL